MHQRHDAPGLTFTLTASKPKNRASERRARENKPSADNELSAEGARWREGGASVVQDLSDVLEHVARSDFSLGCSA